MRNNCARLAVVVGGRSFDGAAFDFALACYNPDGSLDATLDGDGKLATAIGSSDDFATSIAIQSDGKIVAGGYSDDGATFDFARALEVTKFGHGKNDGERVLVVKGVLMATDGFTSCTSAQELTLQRKRDGLFIDKVAGTTAADGSFRFAVPDRRGTYRVMVPASMFPSDGTPTDSCSATQQAMRHRH